MQFVYGPLLTSDRHAILWAARLANPVGSKKPETPSVVGLVSSTPRFLPLPLVNQRPSSIDTNSSTNKLAESSTKVDTASVNQVLLTFWFIFYVRWIFTNISVFRKNLIETSLIQPPLTPPARQDQVLLPFLEQWVLPGVQVFSVVKSKSLPLHMLLLTSENVWVIILMSRKCNNYIYVDEKRDLFS